jgi:hypothetical protein
MKLPRIQLFGKKYCGLCDEAEHQLLKLDSVIRFQLEKIDINKPENKTWLRYQYDIPVLHLNGKPVMKHVVDIHRLQELIREQSE